MARPRTIIGLLARTSLGAIAGLAALAIVLWLAPTSARVLPLADRNAEVVARVLGEPVRRWDLETWPGSGDPAALAAALRLRVVRALRIVSAERWGISVTQEEEREAARGAWNVDGHNDLFLRIFVDNQLRRYRNRVLGAAPGSDERRSAAEVVRTLESLQGRDFTLEELHGVVPAWEIRRMQEARWRIVVTWARDGLFEWKHARELHDRHGGAIVERDGRSVPVEAVAAWLRAEEAEGAFVISDPAIADAFWSWYAVGEDEAELAWEEAFGRPPTLVAPDPGR